jgi:phospholipid/cholesterol/gamma-HCH transport system permease protein
MTTLAKSNPFMVRLLEALGKYILKRVSEFGVFCFYLQEIFVQMFRSKFRFQLIMQQAEFIGNQSLNIILLTGFFTGAAFALSIGPFFQQFKAESIMGAATALSLARELAPVMTAFLLTGRAGSSMTAEIATMKVNEQIDAMEAMAVDPISYLVVPRLIAAVAIMPFLCGIFIFIGVLASFVVGIFLFNIDSGIFFDKMTFLVKSKDIVLGLQKAFAFAIVIAVVACRYGLKASGGAKGVGLATTNSVVATLLALLAVDYVITYFQLVVSP